jgi:flagellar basal-body rod protein FlgC
MAFGNLFSATDIAASGMAAERLRMELAANNIANANSTRTVEGGPYRRQQVLFSAAMDQALASGRFGRSSDPSPTFRGVNVLGIQPDESPFPRVYNPGHPDAGEDGFVEMPNVALPHEMVDLMTAGRAYEANLKSLQAFRQMAEQALSLMRSIG